MENTCSVCCHTYPLMVTPTQYPVRSMYVVIRSKRSTRLTAEVIDTTLCRYKSTKMYVVCRILLSTCALYRVLRALPVGDRWEPSRRLSGTAEHHIIYIMSSQLPAQGTPLAISESQQNLRLLELPPELLDLLSAPHPPRLLKPLNDLP